MCVLNTKVKKIEKRLIFFYVKQELLIWRCMEHFLYIHKKRKKDFWFELNNFGLKLNYLLWGLHLNFNDIKKLWFQKHMVMKKSKYKIFFKQWLCLNFEIFMHVIFFNKNFFLLSKFFDYFVDILYEQLSESYDELFFKFLKVSFFQLLRCPFMESDKSVSKFFLMVQLISN